MQCYWWAVLADLSLLTATFFVSLWYLSRRRFRNLREEYQAHLENMAAINREQASLEYERYMHQQRLQKEQDDE